MSWFFLPCPRFVCWITERRTHSSQCVGNGSSTLLTPTSLNTYLGVHGERTLAFQIITLFNLIHKHNKQQLWAASIPGDRACWSLTQALWDPHQILSCDSHTTSFAAKATTLFHDNPSSIHINYHIINSSESKQIVTDFFL